VYMTTMHQNRKRRGNVQTRNEPRAEFAANTAANARTSSPIPEKNTYLFSVLGGSENRFREGLALWLCSDQAADAPVRWHPDKHCAG